MYESCLAYFVSLVLLLKIFGNVGRFGNGNGNGNGVEFFLFLKKDGRIEFKKIFFFRDLWKLDPFLPLFLPCHAQQVIFPPCLDPNKNIQNKNNPNKKQ